MNILHNAVKFSPPGTTIRIGYDLGNSAFASVSRQDEGRGIRTGEHEAVFERFFTSPSERSYGNTGSGIGLSVAKLAIERIGGETLFDDTASKGARCIIRLSLAKTGVAPEVLRTHLNLQCKTIASGDGDRK